MVQFTKEAMGRTLKTLMKEKKLDDITVKELVERCGINRNTFYYHFHGIYDLLQWMIREELLKAMEELPNPENWMLSMHRTLNHMQEDKAYWMAIYRSSYMEEVKRFLKEDLDGLLLNFTKQAFADYQQLNPAIRANDEELETISKFYSMIVFHVAEDWFVHGKMKGDTMALSKKLYKLANQSMYDAFNSFFSTSLDEDTEDLK